MKLLHVLAIWLREWSDYDEKIMLSESRGPGSTQVQFAIFWSQESFLSWRQKH